jgi:UDP-N-acetylglucosamine--N-acetylmuramyl-(pentapeptide) pyrophosphoryl-undecaprenol N-acetylglucosamine transferase
MNEKQNIETHIPNNDTDKGKLRVIISGGGTGGHIFPAISIANALRKIDGSIEILFVGAENRMEMEKVPAAGYKIIGLPVAGFYRKMLHKNVGVFVKLIKSLLKARKIINDFNPHIVVGVGGYASGPMLFMASRVGIPTVIQEQNSYAGLTNKILAKKASKIFVAYEGMEKYFPKNKIEISGNPVRQGLENTASKRNAAFDYFDLDVCRTTVLCIGGSLGARTLNQSILRHLKTLGESNVQFIWQSGSYYYNDMKAKLDASGYKNIKLYNFISRMDLAYAAAHVIISRAGASSISELCIIGKPVILVPSPNVAEDHQTKNAQALVKKNAAILIKDNEAIDKLIPEVLKLGENHEQCNMLAENIAKMALFNSADFIAKEIINVAS